MKNFKRVAIGATTSIALVLASLPAANAQMSSMSSLLSSSGPSASAPEQTQPDWTPNPAPSTPDPAPAPQPVPVPSESGSKLPPVYLTVGLKDNLESIMELSHERFALRGGGFPGVQNDNLAVAFSQNVAALPYEGEYDFAYYNGLHDGAAYSVNRYSWEYAYFDRGDSLEDIVAPDYDGFSYGSHVTSDENFVYVVMAFTVRPF